MKPLVVILLTYARTEYAVRTIEGLKKHLQYSGDILYYVADDKSPTSHLLALDDAMIGLRILGKHSEKLGYGGGANRAWAAADTVSDLTLWMEDDWELRTDLDLTPHARMLEENPQFGMIRFGYLSIDLVGRLVGGGSQLYWWLNRQSPQPFVFAGHPSLRHRRFHEAYGDYSTIYNPGETELDYVYKFRNALSGPEILWPAEIGSWGIFHHIGKEKSY